MLCMYNVFHQEKSQHRKEKNMCKNQGNKPNLCFSVTHLTENVYFFFCFLVQITKIKADALNG